MFTENEMEDIVEYLTNTPANSKVYLGADSVKYKKNGLWWARYTVVVVVHIGQKHGCKVFSYTEKEQVFDKKLNKPTQRLMAEVYKVVELYTELDQLLLDFEVEIHLDLNSDPDCVSNHVVKQALGYVKGVTGIDAKTKPHSMIASHCADHGAKYQTFKRG